MKDLIRMNSFIYNYSLELGEFYTGKKEEYLSIDDPLAILAAQKRLEENDGDYLAGYVFLSYNGKVIFSEETESEDMLFTWDDFVSLLINKGKETEFRITFLDNSLGDAIISEKNGSYNITFDSSSKNEFETPFLIPKNEFIEAIRKNYLTFMEFCQNENFVFSEESLFRSSIKRYTEIKSTIKG